LMFSGGQTPPLQVNERAVNSEELCSLFTIHYSLFIIHY